MKTVLVTGANRGIGKEIAKQLADKGCRVFQGYRTECPESESDTLIPLQLDVTKDESVRKAREQLFSHASHLDVLINNAGIIDSGEMPDFQTMNSILNTNLIGAIRISMALLPLLEKGAGRIINVSSGMGASSDLVAGYMPYRLSKYALNGFTQLLKANVESKVQVYSMCPGWVRTDMGGQAAPRSVEKGAETAVWLSISNEAENGKFYRDKTEIPF